MITMRRKITEEKDRFGSFDSVIEIDDVKGKSYNVSQREAAETVNYSTRRQAMNSAPAKRKSGEIMPQIKNEQRQRVVDSIGAKTKMLLITYVAVAVILAAVVIGTGIAITNASNKANEFQSIINSQSMKIAAQEDRLLILDDENAIIGHAHNNLNMEIITDYIEIPVLDIAEPVTYTANTNLFDRICRFISKIFS